MVTFITEWSDLAPEIMENGLIVPIIKEAFRNFAILEVYFQDYPARALSALGLLLSVSAPHSGVGQNFLLRHPHENGRNSETKSRKIDSKVPN